MSIHATSGISDSGTSSRMFATLLSWLNDHTSPAFIIGTSNNFTILPPELIRKGRFDEVWWLDLPDVSERKEIWSVVVKKYKRDPANFDIKKLAAKTDKFTGSEIECAFQSAMYAAFFKDKEVDDEHVISAVMDVTPQAEINKTELEKMRKEAVGKLRIAREVPGFEKEMRKIEAMGD